MEDYTHLHWTYSSSSSAGQYLKAENYVNGKKYYYKLSNYNYGMFLSHESMLEVVASRLGIALGFPVLKYTGCQAKIYLDGKERTAYVSKSLNYCKANETSMPLLLYYKVNHLNNEYPLGFCNRVGLQEYIDKMLIFDYLIMNVDRHGRNIEIISKDNMFRVAPIFDNGRCLTYACGNRLENILAYDYTVSGQGNNFIGGINLEFNLKYVSKSYRVKPLTNKIKKEIFYGLNRLYPKEHLEIIWKAIVYRYNVLKQKGIIL